MSRSNIDLAIENLILCNGKDNDYGLYLSGYGGTATFVLSGCEISGNRKGGIYIRKCDAFAIENCEIIDNNDNAGVYISGCSSGTITGSKIKNNTNSSAAGLYVSNTRITIKDCEISGNTSTSSTYSAGGIDVFNGGSGYSLIMEDCVVSGNSSFNGGGVALNSGVTLTMKGSKSKISGNFATGTSGKGGGVYSYLGTFIMEDGEISGNKATMYGGGVYVGGGEFIMNGGKIIDNTADESGGGVYVDNNGTFEMSGGKIIRNTATSSYGGGGVYDRGTFKMSGGEISGNNANCGGGVYVPDAGTGIFTMTGGKIINNTATSRGGGVYNHGTFTMSDGEITGNIAPSGNGVYTESNTTFTPTGGTVQED